jgi:hypothetical protein
MSSLLYLINWTPQKVTPTLNQMTLPAINAASAAFEYYPFQVAVKRDASGPGKPGQWGNVNTLVVIPSSGGTSQIYNYIKDPDGAAPNNALLLWIFPDFVVFSQFDEELGAHITPG